MQAPDLPMRPKGLPRFGRPPLKEVAVAVLFQPLVRLQQGHIGRYWDLIADDFPNSVDQPPVDPFIEGENVGRPHFQVRIGPSPLRRSWFINHGDDRLLQVQSDRFVHNWRGEGENYPHLEVLWKSFAHRYSQFSAWVTQQEIGLVEPYQVEVTYLNLIEGTSLWAILEGVTPPQSGAHAGAAGELPELAMELRYELQGDLRRALYVLCRQREAGLQQIELTYRAQLRSASLEDLADSVATGRQVIVSHFTALTRAEMHSRWEREQ